MTEGTTVMRAISMVSPKDDGDDEEYPSLPDSMELQLTDSTMQASCSVAPHHK